jgi:hypothetical protein
VRELHHRRDVREHLGCAWVAYVPHLRFELAGTEAELAVPLDVEGHVVATERVRGELVDHLDVAWVGNVDDALRASVLTEAAG